MKNGIYVGLMAVMALALSGISGCEDFSSPEGVVRTALIAAKDNNTSLIDSCFAPGVVPANGEQAMIDLLRADMIGADDVRVASTLIGYEKANGRHEAGLVSLERHHVELFPVVKDLSPAAPAYAGTVVCRNDRSFEPCTTIPDESRHFRMCTGHYVTNRTCVISSLQKM